MLELSKQQTDCLVRLRGRGFELVAFPLYASHVGVRRGDCAALLTPVPGGGMQLFGAAFQVVEGNPAVRVNRAGRDVYVWKNNEVPVTPQRARELAAFAAALAEALLGTA